MESLVTLFSQCGCWFSSCYLVWLDFGAHMTLVALPPALQQPLIKEPSSRLVTEYKPSILSKLGHVCVTDIASHGLSLLTWEQRDSYRNDIARIGQ